MVIYSSSGFADERLLSFCSERIPLPIESIRVCIITTAAVPDKKNNQWVRFTKNYLRTYRIQLIDYFDFSSDDATSLKNYKLIILVGGNPYSLFYHVKKTNSQDILFEIAQSNAIVIGISSGALLFTKGIQYISEWNQIMKFKEKNDNTVGLTDFDGLRIADIFLFPHYDVFRSMNNNLEQELRRIEARDGISITRLENDRSLYFENNIMKYV
jgi:dipeptidase E